jgi:hypothetical protein
MDQRAGKPSLDPSGGVHFERSTWAHASGWAQLSSERRTVSCVLLGLSDAALLGRVLPVLSDALTEAGYPWEVVAVDATGSGPIAGILNTWADLPGFRRVAMPLGASAASLLTSGLQAARGDAVLLMNERHFRAVGLIPAMVSQWCDGMDVVRSSFDAFDRTPEPAASDRGAPGDAPFQSGAGASLAEELILLDRRAVGLLLNDR